jgi:serine O-acetyltransferase
VQVKKSLASTKRHPTIENGVVIYANATILGGDVVIGENSIIGANVCITETIQANSVVTVQSENKIFQRN